MRSIALPHRVPSRLQSGALPRLLSLGAATFVLLAWAARPVAAQAPSGAPDDTGPLVGFSAVTASNQGVCEDLYLTLPSGDAFREHLRIITSNPHPAGSPQQVEVANYLTRIMRAAGMEVRQDDYDVYLPQLTDALADDRVELKRTIESSSLVELSRWV